MMLQPTHVLRHDVALERDSVLAPAHRTLRVFCASTVNCYVTAARTCADSLVVVHVIIVIVQLAAFHVIVM